MNKKHINKMPAKLDFMQSLTGLILGLFIMGHILFEASILISNEMMYKVTIMFEGYYLFGETYPGIVSFLAAAVFIIFITHSVIAIRKFPANYKQYKIIKEHTKKIKHEDSYLWIIQVITGFIMFFVGSVHLYIMITQSSNIGPYASAYRIVEEIMGPLYLILLVSVISHAFIGLYRLALKWGFMEGSNTKVSRAKFKKIMQFMIVIYIILGTSSLVRYTYIGFTHDFSDGVRYKSQTINTKGH